MQTRVPGLYACGEAVGGANGANRLWGNAITEAFVFGARAGRNAAQHALQGSALWSPQPARPRARCCAGRRGATRPTWPRSLRVEGFDGRYGRAFRTEQKLHSAIARAIERLKDGNRRIPVSSADRHSIRAGRLAGPAQHVVGRAIRHGAGAGPHREPRRAPAGGSSRHCDDTWSRQSARNPFARQLSLAAARLQWRACNEGNAHHPPWHAWRASHIESFEVAFEHGQSVLDGLRAP